MQGPLSFDLAYAAESGRRKGVAGPVAGAADVLIFPDLNSANLTCKAMMYTADCRFGGVLMGAACPVAFMSRAYSAQTRLRSLALAGRRFESWEEITEAIHRATIYWNAHRHPFTWGKRRRHRPRRSPGIALPPRAA